MKLPNYLFVAVMHAPQAVPVPPPLSKLAGDKFLQQIERYYQPQDEAWSNPDLREIFLPVLRDDCGAPLALTQRWPEQTSSQINHHVFKGGHFFINTSLSEIQSLVLKTLKPLL